MSLFSNKACSAAWSSTIFVLDFPQFDEKNDKAAEIQQLPFRLLIFCALWEGWQWIRNSPGTFWTGTDRQTFLHCARPPDQQNWNQNFSKLILLLINKLFTTDFNQQSENFPCQRSYCKIWKQNLKAGEPRLGCVMMLDWCQIWCYLRVRRPRCADGVCNDAAWTMSSQRADWGIGCLFRATSRHSPRPGSHPQKRQRFFPICWLCHISLSAKSVSLRQGNRHP